MNARYDDGKLAKIGDVFGSNLADIYYEIVDLRGIYVGAMRINKLGERTGDSVATVCLNNHVLIKRRKPKGGLEFL